MPPRKHAKNKKKVTARRALVLVALLAIIAIVVGVVVLAVNGIGKVVGNSENKTTTTTGPKAPAVVSTATVGSSGDVLIHNGVRASAYQNGVFDFNYCFEKLSPYLKKADYSVVNIEFSVATGNKYSSLPFRVPAEVVTALSKTGYNLGITANNHIADGGVAGMKKTMETLTAEGMDFTGSRLNTADKRYLIKDINGIKIGFLNYSYGSYWNTNCFSNTNLPAFYADAETLIKQMRDEGAELVYLYIHWGQEYTLTPNENQTAIAKKMCELGVDLIVGGHPHKIEPIELITDEATGNTTVCLYSSGNLLSGQQIECMAGGTKANSPSCFQDLWHFAGCDYPDVADRSQDTHRLEHGENCNDNGHTEDGVIFYATATRYEDGTVMLTGVDVVPVWCMGRGMIRAAYPTNTLFEKYYALPLEKGKDWKTAFGLSDAEATEAGYSYDRTMKLLGNGIAAVNAHCQKKVDSFVETFKQAQLTTQAQ